MNWAFFLGRMLFGGFFLYSGLHHFTQVERMSAYAAAQGVPLPELAILASGALLVIGSLSVLLGFAPRIGLALIVLFLIPVTLSMHSFWALADAQQRMMQMGNFLKNTALTGAALSMMAVEVPWPLSVDELIQRKRPGGLRRPAHGY
jgi:putative oxidoreductase